jgi:hypothetical protein
MDIMDIQPTTGTGQPTTDPAMPITAARIGVTATGTGTTGKNQKSPELASGLFLDAS